MELRHLRYFVAVAETSSVTAAAKRLGIAQPALTQQVKALEKDVGVALLRRVGRGIELTTAGRQFADDARSLLAECRFAIVKAQQIARGDIGRISIGMTESAAFVSEVTTPIQSFRVAFPEVTLNLLEGRSEMLIKALMEGRIDVAFVRPPVAAKEAFAVLPVHRETLVAVVSRAHRLGQKARMKIKELDGETLIWPSQRAGGGGISEILFEILESEAVVLRGIVETHEFTTALNMASTGLGVALVPESLGGLRPDVVKSLKLVSSRKLFIEIALATRRNQESPTLQNFRAFFSELGKRGDQP